MSGLVSGDWEFVELAGDDSRGMGYIQADGEDILHVGVMGFSKAQNLEIAHLAKAAPYLLEALEKITAGLSDVDDNYALIIGPEVKAARAAILKAKGEETA